MTENKHEVKRALNLLVIATVALYLVLSGLASFAFITNSHRAQEGRDAHHAICVLKSDLERRVREGEQFLKERPNGIPGIPPKVLRNSINGQKSTIKALATATCDKS